MADELFKSQYEEGIRTLQGARKASVSCIKKRSHLAFLVQEKAIRFAGPFLWSWHRNVLCKAHALANLSSKDSWTSDLACTVYRISAMEGKS